MPVFDSLPSLRRTPRAGSAGLFGSARGSRSGDCWRLAPKGTASTLFGGEYAGGEIRVVLRDGDLIAGRYRVRELIGVGGMGVVVAAEHLEQGASVAIKLLLPHLCGEIEAIAQFVREVCALVEIDNEHVARVFDVGTLECGVPYMVMELLEGQDLEAWHHHHGVLAVEQAVEFVLQACDPIAAAHARGIVHRDVKPSNLFVTRRSDGSISIKVLDFGISMVTGGRAPARRRPESGPPPMAGSPHYMSPEQMEAPDEVDGRADIWSLGVCLYELISGCRPFGGTTLPAIRSSVATQEPPPVRALRPDAPAGIERIIGRCLAKIRHCRYRDIAELALDLAPYAPNRARSSDAPVNPRPSFGGGADRAGIIEAAKGLLTRASSLSEVSFAGSTRRLNTGQ